MAFLDDFKKFLKNFLIFLNDSKSNDLEKVIKSFFDENKHYIIFSWPFTILYVKHIFSIWNKNISELNENFDIDSKKVEFFPDYFLTTNFTKSTKAFAYRLKRIISSKKNVIYKEIHNSQSTYSQGYIGTKDFDIHDMLSDFGVDIYQLQNDCYKNYQINIENKKINDSIDEIFNCIIKNNNIKNVNFEIFGKSPFNDDHIFENISYLKDKLKKLEINLFIMVNFLSEDEKHEFLRKAEIFNLNIEVQHYKKSWLNKIIIRKNRL